VSPALATASGLLRARTFWPLQHPRLRKRFIIRPITFPSEGCVSGYPTREATAQWPIGLKHGTARAPAESKFGANELNPGSGQGPGVLRPGEPSIALPASTRTIRLKNSATLLAMANGVDLHAARPRVLVNKQGATRRQFERPMTSVVPFFCRCTVDADAGLNQSLFRPAMPPPSLLFFEPSRPRPTRSVILDEPWRELWDCWLASPSKPAAVIINFSGA